MRTRDWLVPIGFSVMIAVAIALLVVALFLSEPPEHEPHKPYVSLGVDSVSLKWMKNYIHPAWLPDSTYYHFRQIVARQNEDVGAWTVEEPLALYCFPR